MNLTTILDDCLQRLAAGESVAQCLARYPDAAPELAPMLAAAEQVRAFSAARLSQGQLLKAKVALREELAAQGARRAGAGSALGVSSPRWRLAPLAAILAVLLFCTVAFSTVAASQPGDLAYPVRLAVERAPVWFQFSESGRVDAELALAERRLGEVTRVGASEPLALAALLRSHTAAVERAEGLPEEARAEVATRVAEHASELARLAERVTAPQVRVALHQAAVQAQALASRLVIVVDAPPSAPTAFASLVPARTPTPEPSSTPLPLVVPTLSKTPPPPTVPTPVVPSVPPIATVGTIVVPTIPPITVSPGVTWTPPPAVTPDATPALPSHTPVFTVAPVPTIVIATITIPTITVPTVVVPTIVIPTMGPWPTGIATQAVNTPVMPTVVVPTVVVPTFTIPTILPPTVVVPTAGVPPTIKPPGAKSTATVVWMTMTPGVTATQRPQLRLTVTLTVIAPHATETPLAPTIEVPNPTATEAEPVEPTPTPEALQTAMPEATPTLPPMPR
jgi:hypothetical protein